jgi:hypothetical protein
MPNVAASASDDPRRLIQRRNVMTAINAKSEAINAKSEALELHELSSEELDAVSGGTKDVENRHQADALKGFQQALQSL